MNGWMSCGLTSFSTVFHSYQDDGRVNMIKRRVGSEIISPPAGLEPETRDPKSGALTARPRGRFYSRARI